MVTHAEFSYSLGPEMSNKTCIIQPFNIFFFTYLDFPEVTGNLPGYFIVLDQAFLVGLCEQMQVYF